MSHRIDLKMAREHLEELVLSLKPGDEIILTQNGNTVARIAPAPAHANQCLPGLGKGLLTIIRDDDTHLEDFKDYM